MRRTLAFALVLPALVLPFAGCGDKEAAATPAACLTAPGIWITALVSAPEEVAIEQSTPISDCLPADQSPAQQEEVGRTAVEVATVLSRGARGKLRGEAATGERAAVEAGYLVGALEKAARDTEGIHATLVDRVEAAATNGLGEAGQKVQGGYQRGHEAGLESG